MTPWARMHCPNAGGRAPSAARSADLERPAPPAWAGLLTQLSGLAFAQVADQLLTRYRWDGRLHESTGSNMWSSSAKSPAYVQ